MMKIQFKEIKRKTDIFRMKQVPGDKFSIRQRYRNPVMHGYSRTTA